MCERDVSKQNATTRCNSVANMRRKFQWNRNNSNKIKCVIGVRLLKHDNFALNTHTHTHMKFQSKPVFGWPPTIIFGTVVTSRSHQNSLRHHFYFMSIQFYAFFRIYRHMLFIDTGTATTIATITRRRRRKKYYNTTERMCACVFCCCCCFYFSFEEARFQTIPCDL